MGKNVIYIIVGVVVVIVAVIIAVTVYNSRKNNLKKRMNDLYVRFNTIRTIPIAFKLNKAQAMAKRNEETAASVQKYYEKYEEAEKHISNLQSILNDVDDSINTNKLKKALTQIADAEVALTDCEKEINGINDFLEEFSRKEDEQREYSANLKEKYRVVKNTINENAKLLSVAYNGLSEKIQKCEELFSSSEEWMYASDYTAAQADLDEIDKILEDIKLNANAVPKCIKDIKGVLPVMLDEAKREYALTKQRGVYVSHLDIDSKIKGIEDNINDDLKKLVTGKTEGIRENCSESKQILNELIESLAAENRSYKEAKETNDKAFEHINDLKKVENYVRIAYDYL